MLRIVTSRASTASCWLPLIANRTYDESRPSSGADLRRVWLVTTLIERLRNRRNAARRADAIARALQTDPAAGPGPQGSADRHLSRVTLPR